MELDSLEPFPKDDLFHFLCDFGKWKECGDKDALVCAETGRRIKYRELEEHILAAAQQLSALGLQPGEASMLLLRHVVH